VLRALHDLKAGEELNFSYLHPDTPYAIRQKAYHDTWGFKCTCPLCLADSHPEENHVRRAKLVSEEWPKLLRLTKKAKLLDGVEDESKSGLINAKLAQFIEDVEATYQKGRLEPKPELGLIMMEHNYVLLRKGGPSPNVRVSRSPNLPRK
jgi:hypothetical protein